MKDCFHIFIVIMLTSCGLKITNEVEENVLVGDWELRNIFCYANNSSTFMERYDVSNTSDLDVTLAFGRSNIQYTVSSSTCTTSATGNFITEFDGDFADQVDFVDIVTGSTCDVNLAFVGQNGGNTSDVKFALLPTHSKNLNWELSEDKQTLTLDFFTSFMGSNLGGFCGSACTCELQLRKAN